MSEYHHNHGHGHHDHMGYKMMMMMKRCHGLRGFRVNPRRFSVQRLRSKFFFLLKIFNRCRSSYGNALRSMKRNMAPVRRRNRYSNSNSKRNLVMMGTDNYHHDDSMHTSSSSSSSSSSSYAYTSHHHHNDDRNYCRLRYYGRSNSFYSEAIADCLDFIKRNSLSVDEKPVLNTER